MEEEEDGLESAWIDMVLVGRGQLSGKGRELPECNSI